jgi:hypothetical protein
VMGADAFSEKSAFAEQANIEVEQLDVLGSESRWRRSATMLLRMGARHHPDESVDRRRRQAPINADIPFRSLCIRILLGIFVPGEDDRRSKAHRLPQPSVATEEPRANGEGRCVNGPRGVCPSAGVSSGCVKSVSRPGLHHGCTTSKGQQGSRRVTKGQVETRPEQVFLE